MVPRPGFGGGDAALGLQFRHKGQGGQRAFLDARAGRPQRRQGALEGGRDGRLELVLHERRRDRESPGRQRTRVDLERGAAQHGIQQRRIPHRAGDRAGGVQRRGERQATAERHTPCRALEADQTLQRGRDPQRATGVGAERGPGRARGDTDRAAGGRAAGNARPVVDRGGRRVPRRAVMRIDADAGEGEFAQVGVPDQCGAGGAQPCDGRGVAGGGCRVGHRGGGGGGRMAGDVEQVLHRDRQATQRRARFASGGRPIAGLRGGARVCVEAPQEGELAGRGVGTGQVVGEQGQGRLAALAQRRQRVGQVDRHAKTGYTLRVFAG